MTFPLLKDDINEKHQDDNDIGNSIWGVSATYNFYGFLMFSQAMRLSGKGCHSGYPFPQKETSVVTANGT